MENGQDVTVDPEYTLVIELKDGPVVIQMFPQFAPNHVRRIKELAREGFYDGIVWHRRVIDGFMAQTGDPDGRGTGGSGQKLKAEFNGIPYLRGIVGMARAQHPHTLTASSSLCLRRVASLTRNIRPGAVSSAAWNLSTISKRVTAQRTA